MDSVLLHHIAHHSAHARDCQHIAFRDAVDVSGSPPIRPIAEQRRPLVCIPALPKVPVVFHVTHPTHLVVDTTLFLVGPGITTARTSSGEDQRHYHPAGLRGFHGCCRSFDTGIADRRGISHHDVARDFRQDFLTIPVVERDPNKAEQDAAWNAEERLRGIRAVIGRRP